MKNLLLSFFIITFSLSSAYSQSTLTERYLEVTFGQSSAGFNGLDFLNPNNKANTSNTTSGDFIILNNVDKTDEASIGSLSYGGLWGNSTALSISLETISELKAKGYATFGGTAFDQVIKSSGAGVFIGGGLHSDIGSFYFEPKIEIGFASITSKGTQGAEQSLTNAFPSKTENLFVSGISLLLGYELTPKIDAVAEIGYRDFGNVQTGVTGTPPPAGMVAGEQLQSKLAITTASIGLRYKF